jgi:hypothetical protein
MEDGDSDLAQAQAAATPPSQHTHTHTHTHCPLQRGGVKELWGSNSALCRRLLPLPGMYYLAIPHHYLPLSYHPLLILRTRAELR